MAELGRDAADRSLAEVLFSEFPDALFALSFEGKILSRNHGAAVMFGYGSDETIGRRLEDLIVPEQEKPAARKLLEDVDAKHLSEAPSRKTGGG
jgi:PAS domain S-box-containing protein